MNGSETVAQSPQSHSQHQLAPQLIKDSSRIDVDSLMNEFRQELGADKWEIYRDTLTHFLIGKLSRAELVRCLRENLGLTGPAMRNHNVLVLSLLTNACREVPPGTESSLADWKANTRNKSKHTGMDANNDLLHKEILSLPVRERRRIKNISKEAAVYLKDPLFPMLQPGLVSTRKSMLPHIPYVNNREKSRSAQPEPAPGSAGTSGSTAGSADRSSDSQNTSKNKDAKEKDVSSVLGSSNPLLDPLLNLHPGRTSGPLTWTQDIIQGLDAPLISETHELPDESSLSTRMLSVALENGILGGIGPGATDIMLLGLESYFRSIINQLFAMRHKKITSTDPLDANDFNLLADLRPSELGNISAPLLRLRTYFLQDEESVRSTGKKQHVEEEDEDAQNHKRVKLEEEDLESKVLEEHSKGITLIDQLL